MSFEVINPGLIALFQDLGRFGYQHIGITTGGPMDEHAFCWANRMLDNPQNAPQLEITFGKLTLKALADTCIAITGADLNARIGDKKIQPWNTYRIRQGDTLNFDSPKNGLRAYLAVKGGFTIDLQLDSASTVSREKIGGIENGRALKQGDVLRFSPCKDDIKTRTPKWAIPDYTAPLELGVMLGYQYRDFPNNDIMTLFSSAYEVSSNIDRMGYRLSGQAIHCNRDGIISEGIAYGAIQIPKDGQPIVLMRDRQTIGGYPKIGCLSTLGSGQLAQRAPGSQISFYQMDVGEAEAQRVIFNRVMQTK
ncbi:biotin-dependent carboxyltransferase family protein [Vibrio sp. Isolate31]|uniref:5-oxoprolinase subunit C family protein n=1 Tax=unclassified Vibrio TaxID=2614977 RepID=UPI001EFD6BB4|nr:MULTISPECIES: biotin-dependent carboxyltransferase family protein [unclassified Vibrio]MCG9555147.1 biotin-dependent carboxyltransferase family protein [Vibrio sp. Isolate32]MCG9601615.1 biotin-dependent carboxyltransferase family protein [Vibrio sp. Isolate31]